MKHIHTFESFLNENSKFQLKVLKTGLNDALALLRKEDYSFQQMPGKPADDFVVINFPTADELEAATEFLGTQKDRKSYIHESNLNENSAKKKLTVSLTTAAVKSFKKDLDTNRVVYTQVRPTVFELEDTPKARMAIQEAKGRFGMQSVLVKESIDESTFEEFLNEGLSVKDAKTIMSDLKNEKDGIYVLKGGLDRNGNWNEDSLQKGKPLYYTTDFDDPKLKSFQEDGMVWVEIENGEMEVQEY